MALLKSDLGVPFGERREKKFVLLKWDGFFEAQKSKNYPPPPPKKKKKNPHRTAKPPTVGTIAPATQKSVKQV